MKLKTGTVVLIAVVAVIVIALFSGVGSYNGLVSMREEVNGKYASIDVQLKRRMDLIPNLVETVKGFAQQEQSVIDSVTEARAKLAGGGMDRFAAENELSGALSRLLMIQENYPELKSNQNFIQLSDELSGTENRIGTARHDYNEAVEDYNARIRTFPASVFAGVMGFEPAEYFGAPAEAAEPPAVKFTN
jgi:LemA protein